MGIWIFKIVRCTDQNRALRVCVVGTLQMKLPRFVAPPAAKQPSLSGPTTDNWTFSSKPQRPRRPVPGATAFDQGTRYSITFATVRTHRQRNQVLLLPAVCFLYEIMKAAYSPRLAGARFGLWNASGLHRPALFNTQSVRLAAL